MGQRKALGRGLSALLGTPDLETDQLREIDIDRILPNSHQPRKNFAEDALNELADSILKIKEIRNAPWRVWKAKLSDYEFSFVEEEAP